MSRPIPSPWHIYKQDLIKLNLQTVRLAADAMRLPNGTRLSVHGLHSTVGVDSLIATEINFSSTKAFPLADFEGLADDSCECQTITGCKKEESR